VCCEVSKQAKMSVMANISMSHITHIDESYHTYQSRVICSHLQNRIDLRENGSGAIL